MLAFGGSSAGQVPPCEIAATIAKAAPSDCEDSGQGTNLCMKLCRISTLQTLVLGKLLEQNGKFLDVSELHALKYLHVIIYTLGSISACTAVMLHVACRMKCYHP